MLPVNSVDETMGCALFSGKPIWRCPSRAESRERSVKTELTIALIKSLRLEKKPVGKGADGRIFYEDNPSGEPYFVFDASAGAPPGFGVKVAKRKTFVVQRKVEGKTFRATLGSVAEFLGEGGMEAVRVTNEKTIAKSQRRLSLRAHGQGQEGGLRGPVRGKGYSRRSGLAKAD